MPRRRGEGEGRRGEGKGRRSSSRVNSSVQQDDTGGGACWHEAEVNGRVAATVTLRPCSGGPVHLLLGGGDEGRRHERRRHELGEVGVGLVVVLRRAGMAPKKERERKFIGGRSRWREVVIVSISKIGQLRCFEDVHTIGISKCYSGSRTLLIPAPQHSLRT